VALVIADTADADGSGPPAIVIIDFSDGDIEAGLNTTDDGLDDLALSLEVRILRDVQADPGNADIHRFKFNIRLFGCQTEKSTIYPFVHYINQQWIPAYAGMTGGGAGCQTRDGLVCQFFYFVNFLCL